MVGLYFDNVVFQDILMLNGLFILL